jgi:DNA-binding response OmpR family regulator
VSDKAIALLLLEPDRATRQLYVRELEKRWRVVAVERTSEVMDVLATEAISAIILEPGVVEAGQWELLTKVRGRSADATLPIIICSSVDERGKGYELGASAYLVKPVSPQQLSNEVARWLNG